jgi:hypothetical protein
MHAASGPIVSDQRGSYIGLTRVGDPTSQRELGAGKGRIAGLWHPALVGFPIAAVIDFLRLGQRISRSKRAAAEDGTNRR